MKTSFSRTAFWFLSYCALALLFSCSVFDKTAGTTDEVETGTPIAQLLTVQVTNRSSSARVYAILLRDQDSPTIYELNYSGEGRFETSIPPGEYSIWVEDNGQQALQSLTIRNTSNSLVLTTKPVLSLALQITTTPLTDLTGAICHIKGTLIADTLTNDTLVGFYRLQLDIPDTTITLSCELENGSSLSTIFIPGTTPTSPLVITAPSHLPPLLPDSTTVISDTASDTLPSVPFAADTVYFEVPDNQPDYSISQATCFNIPANRDVYNFTTVKVAKEPMTWLAVRVWTEAGAFQVIEGGLWGGHVFIDDLDGDGRIWFVVEPVLEGADALPVQFDWW